MRSRVLIWLSALALLVLIAVQSILILYTYFTKKNQFDERFGALVSEAMSEFNSQDYVYGFDSVLYLLDNLAVEYIFSDPDTLTVTPGQAFYKILTDYREPEKFIDGYLLKAGVDPVFTYDLQINELYLTDLGYKRQVYPDSLHLPRAPAEALLAGTFKQTRNFFQISYDVFINFTNRSKLIMNEMWFILILSIISLILVFTVFYITWRNMMKQKRLSEMKTDFINNMTHELKTPLSTISVASSSLGNRSIIQQSKKVEELSGLIKRQNRHLSEMIDRILDINIWEKDQVKLKPALIKTEKWIRELVDAFILEKGKAAEIKLHLNLQSDSVIMDEVHMSTVINNMLSNAAKYGNNRCCIDIYLREEEGFLEISIKDNGPGIRREELKYIFEKFYRGEESKKKVIKGLGLGLYYVKQIVEAHHGTITATSTPGKGARFQIKIPTENGPTIG